MYELNDSMFFIIEPFLIAIICVVIVLVITSFFSLFIAKKGKNRSS